MLLKNNGQTKNVFPGRFTITGLIWVGIIVVALAVTGCAAPNSSEPKNEIAEIDPAETEEITDIEPVEIEAIVTVEPGSSLAIRKSAGSKDKPEGDVLDRVPQGRVLIIINKHEDGLIKDGYTWWEVEDTVTGILGWSAADFLEEKN